MEPENGKKMADTKNGASKEHNENPLRDRLDFSEEYLRNKPVTNDSLEGIIKVRKRLDFGKQEKVIGANINDLLRDDLFDEQRQKAIEKWNFDFENEVPLEGQWVWERIPIQPKSNKEIVSTKDQEGDDNRAV